MFDINNPQLRHIGAIGFLSMIGLVASMIPISIYSAYIGSVPQEPIIWLASAFCGGSAIGWVLKR